MRAFNIDEIDTWAWAMTRLIALIESDPNFALNNWSYHILIVMLKVREIDLEILIDSKSVESQMKFNQTK